MGPLKGRYLKFAIGFVALGLSLVSAELYMRSSVAYVTVQQLAGSGGSFEANPELLIQYTAAGRRYVPNTHVIIKHHYLSGLDVPININSLGLRDIEFPPSPPANQNRILVLGDSITAGDYLPSDKVYVKLLQGILRTTNPALDTLAINAGIGNVGTEEEVQLLSEVVDRVNPSLVILQFYLNDSRPPWGFAGEIGDHGWLRRHSILAETAYVLFEQWKWLKSQPVDMFAWIPEVSKLHWKDSPSDFSKLAELAQYDWGSAWKDSSWQEIAPHFERLKRLSSEKHFQVMVVAFPVLYQLEAKDLDDHPQKELEKLAEKNGFSFFDLIPALRKPDPERFFFDHCHPNELGNQVIAVALAQALMRSGWAFKAPSKEAHAASE